MDPMMFNNFLHENYLLFFTDIDDIHVANSYLSIADVFASKWNVSVLLGK